MVKKIESAGHVIAIQLADEITPEVAQELRSDVAKALAQHDRLCCYIDAAYWSMTGTDSAMQLFKDELRASGLIERCDRVAVITDNFLLKGMIGMMSHKLAPAEVRIFPQRDSEQAMKWVEFG